MKQNEFDKKVNRRNTNSLKWDIKDNEIPMWVADMDFKTAPAIIKAIEKRARHGIYGYTIIPDIWYESIINWWKNEHQFEIKKEWLQFSTGVVPAISSIVKRITNVGDNIVTLTPVYDIFFHSIENANRKTLESPLVYENGAYHIDFEDLENKLKDKKTTMMIFCNPHNPIGKIWTKEEIEKVGHLCNKYNVVVLSDEIHCDITDLDSSYVPFASVSDECLNNSIVCISASKAFNLAGIQSAAVYCANEKLRKIIVKGLNSDEVAEPNCFAIDTIVAAFNDSKDWLMNLKQYIYENKQIVKTYLKENNLPIKLVESKATYLLWLDCSLVSKNVSKFASFLREKTGLYLSDGKVYRGNGTNFVRMNIACNKTQLNKALRMLKQGVLLYKKIG